MKSLLTALFTTIFLVPSGFAQPSTDSLSTLNVGGSLRLAALCDSDLSQIKLYVGEDFLQDKSLVLLNLSLKNQALGIDVIQAISGELTMNEELEAFEYVLTHEDQVIAKLRLEGEEGVPTRLTGELSIEGFDVTCK